MTTYRTHETHIDVQQDTRYWAGEGDTYTVKSRGELYRQLRDTFGRCVSKVYITTKEDEAAEIGWVFRQKVTNDDYRRPYTYTREVWVEVTEVPEAADDEEE